MIAIIGAGGHAKCVYECFYLKGQSVFGFFDDDCSKRGLTLIDGKKVLGCPGDVGKYGKVDAVFIAIGENRIRLEKFSQFKQQGYKLPNAVHPAAHLTSFSELGEGNFVMAQAVINPGSRVGDCCIINTAATVGHDCVLEDGVQIGPGVNVAGGSVLGEGVFAGIGAKVAPGLKIGAWAVIGAGAVVLEDVPDGVFCCGIPAKNVRKNRAFDS